MAFAYFCLSMKALNWCPSVDFFQSTQHPIISKFIIDRQYFWTPNWRWTIGNTVEHPTGDEQLATLLNNKVKMNISVTPTISKDWKKKFSPKLPSPQQYKQDTTKFMGQHVPAMCMEVKVNVGICDRSPSSLMLLMKIISIIGQTLKMMDVLI